VTPNTAELPKNSGLMYNDPLDSYGGIYSTLSFKTISNDFFHKSFGTCGISILSAPLFNLSRFLLSRNNNNLLSLVEYAFKPSNNVCP